MVESDVVEGRVYWYVTPGNLMTYPYEAPEVICVRCTKFLLSNNKFVRNFYEFERVDNNKPINIFNPQFVWMFTTKEDADRYLLDRLTNFCKDIKLMFRQLKEIHSQYRKLKNTYS